MKLLRNFNNVVAMNRRILGVTRCTLKIAFIFYSINLITLELSIVRKITIKLTNTFFYYFQSFVLALQYSLIATLIYKVVGNMFRIFIVYSNYFKSRTS